MTTHLIRSNLLRIVDVLLERFEVVDVACTPLGAYEILVMPKKEYYGAYILYYTPETLAEIPSVPISPNKLLEIEEACDARHHTVLRNCLS